jgi:hypothetical protein
VALLSYYFTPFASAAVAMLDAWLVGWALGVGAAAAGACVFLRFAFCSVLYPFAPWKPAKEAPPPGAFPPVAFYA